MGGFLWDMGSGRIALTPGAAVALDFPPGEFVGEIEAVRDRLLAEDLPGVLDDAVAALAAASDYGTYFRVRSRDGRVRWVHAQASVRRDEEGRPARVVGTVRSADAELGHAARQGVLASEWRHQSDVVQAIGAELAQVLTVDDLLAFFTGQPFLDVFGASGVVLSVLDQDRRQLLATTGLPAELLRDLGTERVDADLPIAEAIRTQQAMYVTREDVRDRYPRLWPYIEPTVLTSTAIIPFAAQGRPTGALSILYEGKRVFSAEERNLMLAFGSAAAQALERALLYDREHAMSVALQQAMLPGHIPQVPGVRLAVRYQPARGGHQVGGDWYDAMPLPDGTLAVVVGDVQGHDVHAAAVMGQLRAAFRAYATEGHSPSAIMARASAYLRDMDTDLLATCACAHLDPRTGSGRLVRAGHPYPIVKGPDRHSAPVEAAGGLPLGLPRPDAADDYPTTHIRLRAGDTLVLFTDGLLESRGSDLDSGEHRLRALLDDGPDDPGDLADLIVSDLERGQADDIAILLARVGDGAGADRP
ncbi:SpoIIE family protein phosphatase [Actinacidiphila acididurans]|uniref:SpoIIE family protein phosphatase n=1 Tax=Actinacidiphila acididurans TaxID=2784346 RepID=A0ABS2U4D0_9ACTN|nr:SpoIIE family protein phosphatase [Actinacidiphila acididurans]MBM9510456.1 SpoIIE family protein phosphatase [Actinacidiphila acididurans]